MLLVGVNDDGLRRLRDEANRFKQGYAALEEENAKLRELVDGFTWCCGHNCGQECPLYDVSEPDYCRETSIKRELGIEV